MSEIIIEKPKTKALLVGVCLPSIKKWEAEESFEELKALADTAGVDIIDEQFVELRTLNPATLIGKGKVEELKLVIEELCAEIVIFDSELAPSQTRNLQEQWKIQVLDRSGIILDIFALHARSKEGKLQVELAQYEYLYPRLVGAWTHLSKQRGGGVGLRGPGETQLEVDRRIVRRRMGELRKRLEKVSNSRQLHRQRRNEIPIPTITLVGYTNAGKSTLFNSITDSVQLAEDQLFATLDPKTKKVILPSGRECLLADTVGFIRNLPHQLIESFKSTFEEAGNSDLLLLVIDGSNPSYRQQIEVVVKVIEELKLNDIPLFYVYNKSDSPDFHLEQNSENTICISAKTKIGIDLLLEGIDKKLTEAFPVSHLFLPYPNGDIMSILYKQGRIIETESDEEGTRVTVCLPEKWRLKLKEFEA